MAGSLKLLQKEVVTSPVSSVDLGGVNWSTNYDNYLVIVNEAYPQTDATQFRMRFLRLGLADTTSSYDYAYEQLKADSANASITANNISYTIFQTPGTGGYESSNLRLNLFNMNDSSYYSFATVENFGRPYVATFRGLQGSFVLKRTIEHNGVHFYYNGGNINSGTFLLYGYKK